MFTFDLPRAMTYASAFPVRYSNRVTTIGGCVKNLSIRPVSPRIRVDYAHPNFAFSVTEIRCRLLIIHRG